MSWDREDFSNYHKAPSAWYKVESNGKVDISMEQGRDEKISLQSHGMFKLVKDWLTAYRLTESEKQQLLDVIQKSEKSTSTEVTSETLKQLSERLASKGITIDPEKIKELTSQYDPMRDINEFVRKSQQQIQDTIDKIHKK